jgi:hypothetical protein
MWFKAMEEVSKCKKELDEFMTMENKSAEEDAKVIELSELVDQSLEPMLKRPKLADEIHSHVESSGVPPIPAHVSHDNAECSDTPIMETTALGALQQWRLLQRLLTKVQWKKPLMMQLLLKLLLTKSPMLHNFRYNNLFGLT